MQGAQSSISRSRGVGRYSLALAKEMARSAGSREVWVALSGLFPESVEPLRAAFDGLIPQDRIGVWQAPAPIASIDSANHWRRDVGERLRESFLSGLRPDVVHISSLFEGFVDDGVTSIRSYDNTLPSAVTLYDLIPFVHRDLYLANPAMESWYERKLTDLRRANLWLAISESSRQEAINCLNLPDELVINVSTAADDIFRPVSSSPDEQALIRRRYGLSRRFVMYTGGIDPRKNIEGLIGAYARLPEVVRAGHQLAIVCAGSSDELGRLARAARSQGLGRDEVVFTGFVTDDDLVALYNLCEIFVFPSWHEGFGLPALEAMACGAATIGSDASSIPEVIGRGDALFDPRDEDNMAAKMYAVLTDAALRQDLRRHALQQAKMFSWASTAHRAWNSFDWLYRNSRADVSVQARRSTVHRPRLAYVSPLPPAKSGISAYSAELLPELARHYDIDTIVDQPYVDDPWIRANATIRPIQWFDQNARIYDRILYHFGNSSFHRHMFDMLERYPGVVVLHDFFLSGVIAHMNRPVDSPESWPAALYVSHGYHSVKEHFTSTDPVEVVWKYPGNFAVLQQAEGVIVHSEFSRELANVWYGHRYSEGWAKIPHLRKLPTDTRSADLRASLGFREGDFLTCSFGMIGPTKLNDRLLAGWLASPLAHDPHCHLIFVGQKEDGAYGASLGRLIAQSGVASRIHVTGFVSPAVYRSYLLAADAAVQLRARSRGETSGTVLDCLAYGLPTIVNAVGALVELPSDCALRLSADFSNDELEAALSDLWRDPLLRSSLRARGMVHVRTDHHPRTIADQYYNAIERFAQDGAHARSARLSEGLARVENATSVSEADWLTLARMIAENESVTRNGPRQWLVDISELVRRDSKSGIQRVVRAALDVWLNESPRGFRVEPVYCDGDGNYRYARRFATKMLGVEVPALADEPMETRPGDIFIALDLFMHLLPARRALYRGMRQRRIRMYFVVYDLLLAQRPDFFLDGGSDAFRDWLSLVAEVADGAICISRTVADELSKWLDRAQLHRARRLQIGWFHLGADIASGGPAREVDPSMDDAMHSVRLRPSVLMVGTIEPRKGYAQALAAFEILWARDPSVNLVIVGKPGWMAESMIRRLRDHPENGGRLLWFEDATDEQLQALYEASAGVLMASEGEGFGLPLIEAARHSLPILARDLPVFREVVGEHATYFSGLSAESLVEALEPWLIALRDRSTPNAGAGKYLTWQESVNQLTDTILLDQWYLNWSPRTASPHAE